MKKSYLHDVVTPAKRDNYFINTQSSYGSNLYLMDIDKEIDIFSELPMELFFDKAGRNQMAMVMRAFKKTFYDYVSEVRPRSVMPKLMYYVDEEGASIVQLASSWKGGNASVYFSFEKDEQESSFGMVWNDQIKRNFESRSGSISRNDTDEIIHEVIDFIFRVY